MIQDGREGNGLQSQKVETEKERIVGERKDRERNDDDDENVSGCRHNGTTCHTVRTNVKDHQKIRDCSRTKGTSMIQIKSTPFYSL